MSMRVGTKARRRIIAAAIDQPRTHPRKPRGIELFDHVGKKQDIAGGKVERSGDAPITVRIALAAGFGIEMTSKQRRKIAHIAVRE